MASKVWFITGCSTGFGKCIAEAALRRGDTVVATARKMATLANLASKSALVYELDVTWPEDKIKAVVADVLGKTSRIDVLVNNAGYILSGGIEETSPEEIYDQYNTNIIGQHKVLRAILPHFRSNHSGVIANLASIGSHRGLPAAGFYCSSKAAISLNSEALRAEVAHLGIEVVAVEPGHFRTNFLTNANRKRAQGRIKDIAGPVEASLKSFDEKDCSQPGDPVRAAQLLVEVLTKSGRCVGRALPGRLALGSDAVEYIPLFMEEIKREIEEWKELTTTLGFE